MSPLNSPIFHSRPRAEVDWECSRKRFYLYEYDGKGLSADIESLEQFFGSTIHDGTAAVATMHKADGVVDIDVIATAAQKQTYDTILSNVVGTDEERDNFASEQAALAEGLLRGFYRHVWPRMLATYPKIVMIEQDVSFRHNSEGLSDPNGNYQFICKPDIVLAKDDESEIVYHEYKTTANKKDKWINSWDRSIQAHATLAAIQQTLGIDCTGIIVQGLYKGYESYGKLATPICYAYHKWGNPPFTRSETLYEYKPGFRRYPSWQLEGGVKKWMDEMPDEVLMEQFPASPVIFPDETFTTTFFRQRATREEEILFAKQVLTSDAHSAEKKALLMDQTFPQTFNKCKPAWGFECPMQVLCFGNISDPLKAGFTPRTPHHAAEIEAMEVSK